MSFSDDTFASIFRLGGGWGNISGPGLFMTKAFIQGTIKAAVCGFAGATGAALIYGTAALPFVISASIGFAIGSIGFYRDSIAMALLDLHRYPLVLRLHLQRNFPAQRFDRWNVERLRSDEFRRSWVLSNMLVASWLSAHQALERLQDQEEDAIVVRELERGDKK